MWRLLFTTTLALASQVVFVAEMCRHGSRAPISMYPWDQDGRWSIGAGELTVVGMRQHFLLGSELRQRYIVNSELLQSSYNEAQVYFRSTNYNRTLMSAQSQLMGMFPVSTGPNLPLDQAFDAVPPISVLNENHIISSLNGAALPNLYQVLPVHTVPGNEDYVLQAPESCPLLSSNLAAIGNSAAYISAANSNPAVTQAIAAAMGVQNATQYVSSAIDSLKCNLAMGYTVPQAFQSAEFMANATQVFNQLFSLGYQSDQNARLYSTGFFLDLIPHLQGVQEGIEPTKFRLYSAHDDIIAGILAGLQVFNNVQPPFASTLIFEVSVVNYAYYVRVLYNDQVLSVNNCGSLCPLSQFISFLQQRAYPNFQAACELPSVPTAEYQVPHIVAFSALGAVCLLLLLGRGKGQRVGELTP